MVAKALNVPLNLKYLESYNNEHLTAEYLKINPAHTFPTLVKDDFVLWESRAILGYLVNKYAESDSLYPKDPVKRAIVDQRLYFDMGTLYHRFSEYYYTRMYGDPTPPGDPEKFKKLEEAVGIFDKLLETTKYAAGDNITIADYSLIAGFVFFAIVGYDFSKFSNVTRWYELCTETIPELELHDEGIEWFKDFLKRINFER